jgi:hypothetical protein
MAEHKLVEVRSVESLAVVARRAELPVDLVEVRKVVEFLAVAEVRRSDHPVPVAGAKVVHTSRPKEQWRRRAEAGGRCTATRRRVAR